MFSADRFQLLAASAQVAVIVLANADVTDIELIPVKPHTISDDEVTHRCAGRVLHFAGVLGLVDGVGHSQLAEPLDEQRVSALADAFTTYCVTLMGDHLEREIAKHSAGDFVEWAQRLYRLPDARD